MSEKNHTPGPWEAVNYDSVPAADEHPKHWKRIVGPRGRHVAYLARGYSGEGPHEDDWTVTHEANARLIAAAPELLAVVKALAYWGRACDDERISDEGAMDGIYEICEAASAVLDKVGHLTVPES